MLTGAEDVVALALTLLNAALHLTWLPQRDADLGHDEPDGARGSHHGGHHRIGPAVLGRDHVAVRRQVAEGELGRPGRVVGLHRDERDVVVTGQARGLVKVHGRGTGREGLVRSRHRDAALADDLDLLGPRIDQGHVVALA